MSFLMFFVCELPSNWRMKLVCWVPSFAVLNAG